MASDYELYLDWRVDRQEMSAGDMNYVNVGYTATEPSHDLAHLIVAANGGLPWRPTDIDRERRLCEYNAVMVENILGKIHHYKDRIDGAHDRILSETIKHMRWFVEEHYAPFPVLAEEAYRIFCSRIKADRVSRLSPVFFNLREIELSDPEARSRGVQIRISSVNEAVDAEIWTDLSSHVHRLLNGLRQVSEPIEIMNM